jgi:hypothetical protein
VHYESFKRFEIKTHSDLSFSILLDWRTFLDGLDGLGERPVKRGRDEVDDTLGLAKRVRGFNL